MYELIRERYFEKGILQSLLVYLGFAFVTGVLAQIRIYLPWTPVPITGSTVGIVLTGMFLGERAIFGVLLYVGLGILGVPWFAGLNGGIAAIVGPTGGYLLGFILASWFIGKIYTNLKYHQRFGAILFAHIALIYIPGILGLALWFKAMNHSLPGIFNLLMMGMIPFIPGDAIKSALLAFIPARKTTF